MASRVPLIKERWAENVPNIEQATDKPTEIAVMRQIDREKIALSIGLKFKILIQ